MINYIIITVGKESCDYMKNINGRKILAINMKYYRYQYKLSQEKLGDLLGSSLSYINQLENELRNPSIDMLDKIAKAFKINTSLLLKFNKNHIIKASRVDQKKQ